MMDKKDFQEIMDSMVPHPCTKTNLSFMEQRQKIMSELDELDEAIANEDSDAILEEGTDVIVAMTTLLAKRYSLVERLKMVQKVNQKNHSRGYY